MILILGLACTNDPVVFDDSTDLTLDFGLTRKDHLNSPYVRGASIRVDASHRWVNDHEGWSLEVSDPDVLFIESQGFDFDEKGRAREVEAQLTAVGEGEVELFLVDETGERRGSAVAEVFLPDELLLSPHGPLMMDREDLIPEQLGLLEGQTTTLLARYFAGGVELAGTEVLGFEPTLGVSLETDTSFLGEDRDWLLVTPDTEIGAASVPLLVDGEHIADLDFDVIDSGEVDELRLIGLEQEDSASGGEHLQVLAQPFAGDEAVFGGEAVWNLGGQPDSEVGDLLQYEFDPNQPRQVVATLAGHSVTETVHGSELFVRTSDTVGCSSTGSRSMLWGLLALPLLVLRRRA